MRMPSYAQKDRECRQRVLQSSFYNTEHLLIQRTLQAGVIPHPYIYMSEFEWEVVAGRSDLGKGDAVFIDAAGERALIVEFKVLSEVRLAMVWRKGVLHGPDLPVARRCVVQ